MNQITIRQIPKRTYQQLKMIAKKNKTSINKTIIALIHNSLGLEESTSKKRNIRDLAGTWSNDDYQEFSRFIKSLDKIDDEVWK